ncbi:MAG: hypothetical protein M3094_08265, partial [Actinomycetia bacterium]|nr:hypothetical protein [Actinomycetes bacterium]
MAGDTPYNRLRERISGLSGVVMVIGSTDTGKTTMAKMLVDDAVAVGRTVAYVDADIAASTVGPPACVGLRFVTSTPDVETLSQPDELRFVGAVEPHGVVLPHV